MSWNLFTCITHFVHNIRALGLEVLDLMHVEGEDHGKQSENLSSGAGDRPRARECTDVGSRRERCVNAGYSAALPYIKKCFVG